jgi:3-methyladenine DNA glycosylase AlkD
MSFLEIQKEILKLKNPDKAGNHQRFFKTGKGEYGEGDKFLGISTPPQRLIAKKFYQTITLADTKKLLKNKYHEFRLIALIILTYKFPKADKKLKKQIFNLYLKNTKHIINWDLVDISAPRIVGEYLLDKDKKILYQLAKSKLLWDKRIAILSCFAFIKNNDFKDIIKLSELLIKDKHDLMHKAIGWMLREMGKKDQKVLEKFLNKHIKNMPRTMLRYSIEKFAEKKRKYYLNK